MANVKDALRTI